MKLKTLLSSLLIITSLTFPSYTSSAYTNNDWDRFIKETHSLKKESILKNPITKPVFQVLPEKNAVPMEDVSILVTKDLKEGGKIAVEDLKKYLEAMTGKTISIENYSLENKNLFFEKEITTKNLIVIGKVPNTNTSLEAEQEFFISTKNYRIYNRDINLIYLEGNSLASQQYAIYHLMELTGKRFFYHKEGFSPNPSQAKLPANNFLFEFKTNKKMKVRGFAPHLYHPIPLSIAFHDPSEEHFNMIKEYLDWLVQNKQNYVIFPMLELDKKSKYLPLRDENKPKFKEWLPFANKIVNYAHQRGLKISIKLAFANFVSANSFALNPFKTISKSMNLDNKWKKVEKILW